MENFSNDLASVKLLAEQKNTSTGYQLQPIEDSSWWNGENATILSGIIGSLVTALGLVITFFVSVDRVFSRHTEKLDKHVADEKEIFGGYVASEKDIFCGFIADKQGKFNDFIRNKMASAERTLEGREEKIEGALETKLNDNITTAKGRLTDEANHVFAVLHTKLSNYYWRIYRDIPNTEKCITEFRFNIDMAIKLAKVAKTHAEKIKGDGEIKYSDNLEKIKINLAYHLAYRYQFDGAPKKEDKEEALALVKNASKYSDKLKEMGEIDGEWYEIMESYAWVLFVAKRDTKATEILVELFFELSKKEPQWITKKCQIYSKANPYFINNVQKEVERKLTK